MRQIKVISSRRVMVVCSDVEKVSIRDINTAYDWLNVTSATPDDFILSAYKVRVRILPHYSSSFSYECF
jgi:hypothetical protein